MFSKVTESISLNKSHFLTAVFVVVGTPKVSKEPGYYMIVLI